MRLFVYVEIWIYGNAQYPRSLKSAAGGSVLLASRMRAGPPAALAGRRSLLVTGRERITRPVADMQHRDDAVVLISRINNPVDVPPAPVQ